MGFNSGFKGLREKDIRYNEEALNYATDCKMIKYDKMYYNLHLIGISVKVE